MFRDAYQGKRVWLSGITGFKGAWMAEWLLQLGAEVTGFALPPPTSPSLFEQTRLSERVTWHNADLRDPVAVSRSIQESSPDFVFHLAAQPLVRLSYELPAETWSVNVMGTIHVLEALRSLPKTCQAVLITTDKCYENREWLYSYREEDSLGGYDPYSSSKAGAEIAIAAWRRSFFSSGHPVRIASARAGNVVGGGDWAKDRIIPDCVRALASGASIPVRNKFSTRPWQHVLEPLSGYLWLAARMEAAIDGSELSSAFNFGPGHEANRTVAELVTELLKHWPGKWEDKTEPGAVHEARLLNLATDKAFHRLAWRPAWQFPQTIQHTISWYRACSEHPADAHDLTLRQIRDYGLTARAANIAWACS